MEIKYKVEKIFEDDYGCEERSDSEKQQVIVYLWSPEGDELSVKQPDEWIYEQEINEGDEAFLIDGKLHKVLGAD